METQRRQITTDGYVIVRGMIRPDELEVIREGVEWMVEDGKARSSRNRKPDEPEGGAWEMAAQPRAGFEHYMDEPRVAPVLEFCLGSRTYEFSRQLLGPPDDQPPAEVTPYFFSLFQVLCNASAEHGPGDWHRDLHPKVAPPLDGLQQDVRNYGPHGLQWNIALYDDEVLYVVPGSHIRRNTPQETEHAMSHPDRPLPGAIQAKLKAGDGVVYPNMILHWGSNYGTTLRRTLHMGFRPSDGRGYRPYTRYICPAITTCTDAPIMKHLAPWAQQRIERTNQLWAQERDLVDSALRAILDRDGRAFKAALIRLHPGETGRMVCVVFLQKTLTQIDEIKRGQWEQPQGLHPDDLTHRFTPEQIEALLHLFEPVESRLQRDEDQLEPLFQPGPKNYAFYEMPEDFDVDDFIASWDHGP